LGDTDTEYTEFVRARLPQWRRIGFLMTGDWDRGDDVVQRTLVELYEKWGRARRADNLDGFVRTMLMRRFLDERRRGWARVRLVSHLPDRAGPGQPDAGDRLALVAALRQLPPRQRAVLVLRYLVDLDVESTAAALDCAPGTVKSQTARGLATLRQIMAAVAAADRNRG
jgi:RNA polymerase sigma-70 factor (sigma-E family)